MTLAMLERDWLSLRFWLLRCVLPSVLILLAVLAILKLISPTPRSLDHRAVIAGFFALYYMVLRGGHLLMIRSLHQELRRKNHDAYAALLAQLNPDHIKARKLGGILAQMKYEIFTVKQTHNQD